MTRHHMQPVAGIEREDRWFSSSGTRCAGWFYPPADRAPRPPLLVIGHGLSGVRHMRLDDYARDFAAAGMAVFVFDYRGFGDSEGTPRQVVNAKHQLEDWRAAIDFARRELPVDPDRVGVWGTSFSGGHVMTLAAEPELRITAAVAQAPFTDGLASTLRRIAHFPPGALVLGTAAIADLALSLIRRGPLLMPVAGARWMPAFVAAPGTMPAMTNLLPRGSRLARRASRALRWLPGLRRKLGDRLTPSDAPPANGRDSLWGIIVTPDGASIVNAIAARLAITLAFHRPGKRLRHTGRTPVLVCVCDGDEVAPAGPTIRAARGLDNVELEHFNVGHFDIYGGAMRELAVGKQAAFLRRHLVERSAPAATTATETAAA